MMPAPHRARRPLLVSVVTGFFGVASCSSGKTCPTVSVANVGAASLTGAESRTVSSSTGGPLDAAAPPSPPFQVTSVVTALSEYQPDADLSSPRCIEVTYNDTMVGFSLSFECPPGPGSYPVAQLRGQVCQVDADCGPLTGTMTVRAIALPCPQEGKACGQLDASLEVESVPGGPGPTVSGKAQLTYSETLQEESCAPSSLGVHLRRRVSERVSTRSASPQGTRVT